MDGTTRWNGAWVRTLEAVAVLGLLSHDVEDGVDELGALGVVALGPVVAGAGLAEDEVVGAEDAADGAGAERVHGARLEVHEHRPGHVPAAAGLVVVDVDPLQLLRAGRARVLAGRVDAVLAADHLPELGADLVAALAALDVQDLPHLAAQRLVDGGVLGSWWGGFWWRMDAGALAGEERRTWGGTEGVARGYMPSLEGTPPSLSSVGSSVFSSPRGLCMDQAYKQFLYLHQGKQLMEKVAGVAAFFRQLVLVRVSFRLMFAVKVN
jgi:hypothetical protein